MSFAQLKKTRGSALSDLADRADKIKNPPKTGDATNDDRFWKPTLDKAGNGFAIIRFLPAPEGETAPWVSVWSHGFKGPSGKWYINNSLTTLGREDPVGIYNSKLWNSGDEDTARKQKRRQHFISNIYVVKDPGNPENEGKVFLYRYGKKVFEKLNNALNPQFQDEDKINPFDLWNGANFRLKIRKVENYPNYDLCAFDTPSVLGGLNDEDLEKVWNGCFSLAEFLDEKNFKSYDKLHAELKSVLGFDPLADHDSSSTTSKPKPAAQTASKPSTAADHMNDDDDDSKAPWKDDDDDTQVVDSDDEVEDSLAKKLRELAGG